MITNQKVEFERIALTEKEAAQYLGVSRSTLAQSRMNGFRENRFVPPPFVKIGRAVRYIKQDLDSWLMKQRVDLSRQGLGSQQ